MNCWDCGSFNSSLAEACGECGAPLDVEHLDKRELARRKIRGVKKRKREQIVRNQRTWASALLGLGVAATPLVFLYERHEALAAARLLGMTNATVVPDAVGWVVFGAVCAVALSSASARRAWLVFGLAAGLSGYGCISDVARAGVDYRVAPGVLLFSLAAYLLHQALNPRSGRQR